MLHIVVNCCVDLQVDLGAGRVAVVRSLSHGLVAILGQ